MARFDGQGKRTQIDPDRSSESKRLQAVSAVRTVDTQACPAGQGGPLSLCLLHFQFTHFHIVTKLSVSLTGRELCRLTRLGLHYRPPCPATALNPREFGVVKFWRKVTMDCDDRCGPIREFDQNLLGQLPRVLVIRHEKMEAVCLLEGGRVRGGTSLLLSHMCSIMTSANSANSPRRPICKLKSINLYVSWGPSSAWLENTIRRPGEIAPQSMGQCDSITDCHRDSEI